MIELPEIEHGEAVYARVKTVTTRDVSNTAGNSSTQVHEHEHSIFYHTNSKRIEHEGVLNETSDTSYTTNYPARSYQQTMERKGDEWASLDVPVEHEVPEHSITVRSRVKHELISATRYSAPSDKLARRCRDCANGTWGIEKCPRAGWHAAVLSSFLNQNVFLGIRENYGRSTAVTINPVDDGEWIWLNTFYIPVR